MFHVQKISALDLPELAPYRTMRRSAEHEAQGIFIAEGEKVARRLLESHFTVVSIVLPEEKLVEFRSLLESRPEQVTVHLAEKKLLETLVGFSLFQGVLAVGKIPSPASLAEILQKSPRPQLFVAVDEVSNAENLGALVRNCVAFGVQGLIVGETSSSPFLRRAVRNSMGAIFQLPVIELGSRIPPGRNQNSTDQNLTLAQMIQFLRARKIRCIAAHPHTNKKFLAHADFKKDCCIVFGSEGKGISQSVLESCDEAVAISMSPKIDSLNVGAAAAIFLYEANRQREKF